MDLRPYQQALLDQVRKALGRKSGARVMMQLPTGGGKTIIAAALLAEHLKWERKAVWLTHRHELADQTCRMLTDAGVTAVADARWDVGTPAPAIPRGVVVLMAQKVGLANRRESIWGRYTSDDLLVIDEAHHATAPSWTRAIQQWRGPVLGMTATPWRLSRKEGFDHLFDSLLCGPQVSNLQRNDWLCRTRLVLPSEEESIVGGAIDRTGDYTESGIEQANRRDVMTEGVYEFWRNHAEDRPTIAYAVSKRHADNLVAVFNRRGVRARTILSDTRPAERRAVIEQFRKGHIKVLVNVVVATEGFDLPDASCIIMARPTLSLALYMQMAGRGMRPKEANGDCLLLDVARNALTHGFVENDREWSLEPRTTEDIKGEPAVVRCPDCEGASPAASHHCQHCHQPFGKDCDRCGKWRARRLWRFETHCGDAHQLVCDLCHVDAHRLAHLPVEPPLDELLDAPDPDPPDVPDMEPNDKTISDVDDQVAAALRRLLQQEMKRAGAANATQRQEAREAIANREKQLEDDKEIDHLFRAHIANLPPERRPTLKPEEFQLYKEWIEQLQDELATWKQKLADLEGHPLDNRMILGRARETVLALLDREARAADLLPPIDASPVVAPAVNTANLNANESADGAAGRRPTPSPSPTSSNALPVTVFIESSRPAPRARALFHHNRKIVVMTGSLAVRNESLNLPEEPRRLRLWLIQVRILIDEGNTYRFTRNFSFTSPSEAACIVLGRSANGWTEWMTANGVPLESFRREPQDGGHHGIENATA